MRNAAWKKQVFPSWGEGQKCRKQRVTLPFLGMICCGLKEKKKKWWISHWQRKMVNYTIFSYRSEPLFSLASSLVRLLLNLLSSTVLLPPPLWLLSRTLKAEGILEWVIHNSSETAVNLKDTLSSGWVPPTACTRGISSDSIALSVHVTQTRGFSHKGRRAMLCNWILSTNSIYLSLCIPEVSFSEFLSSQACRWENITNCTANAKFAAHGNYRQFQPQC